MNTVIALVLAILIFIGIIFIILLTFMFLLSWTAKIIDEGNKAHDAYHDSLNE